MDNNNQKGKDSDMGTAQLLTALVAETLPV